MTSDAQKEKNWAAGSSVVAAVGLTVFKIIVGLATGSLGILAEAAHSGLDLVAAIMTWFAVRISGRPADSSHLYGHGKVENLSALAETILLLATCGWILYGAGQRIVSGKVDIEVNFWSFAVMVTSIVVDVSRSRVLHRAAHKHKSQALEADALHFSTDIWSSAVVIVGLVAVLIAERRPSYSWLRFADSVAAIIVALIVLKVILQLGLRTVDALVDAAPEGIGQKIVDAARAVPGVEGCHNVRVRTSGPQTFIDVHVMVDGGQTLQQAHDLTEEIERAIQAAVPGSDVTVHPEPIGTHVPESDEARG